MFCAKNNFITDDFLCMKRKKYPVLFLFVLHNSRECFSVGKLSYGLVSDRRHKKGNANPMTFPFDMISRLTKSESADGVERDILRLEVCVVFLPICNGWDNAKLNDFIAHLAEMLVGRFE